MARGVRSAVAVAAVLVLTYVAPVAPAFASGPINCSLAHGKAPSGFLEISFFGTDTCGPEPAAMKGITRLINVLGVEEATGSAFDCAACNIAGSTGKASPALPGTPYTLVFDTVITLPQAHVFGTVPVGCTGAGTPTATCHIEETIVA